MGEIVTAKDVRGFTFAATINFKKPTSWISKLPPSDVEVDMENLQEFFALMRERQLIWVKRNLLKKDAPWTKNAILRDYKFTNVYRELDRASQFAIKYILTQEISIEQKLFQLFVFRFYNQPNSFKQNGGCIDLPDYNNWDVGRLWKQTVEERERTGNPWHTAYMMNMAFAPAIDVKRWNKPGLYKDWAYTHICFEKIHDLIPDIVKILKTATAPEGIIRTLEKIPAVSSFQSHEFYIDLTYFQRYSPYGRVMIFDANDFTNVGPGASLGLRLIFPNLKPNEQIHGIYHLQELAEICLEDFNFLTYENGKYGVTKNFSRTNLNLHQIEMWLCEYSKYWKMKLGEGKQRSKFKPN